MGAASSSLEKIASEPEPQRISLYSAGGSPAGIFAQTQKLFCHNFTADPGAIPIVNTYFLHAKFGECPTLSGINAYRPAYAARILNASGVRQVEGFYTNGTHLNWTINEIDYGEKISRLTGGAHFVINTSGNGRGPKRNPHPVTQGNEDLCNPPGRGLGPQPTTSTGFAHVDAFVWATIPGNSSGCGGGPPGATFWPARAIGMADRANGQLGPGYPSRPY